MIFSCDIEADGINPTQVWCIVAQDIHTKNIFKFTPDTLDQFNRWLTRVDTLIFHNGIAYDVPVLKRLLHTDFTKIQIEDTMIMSQITDPRRDGGHSLRSWGDRLGYDKGDHEDWSQFSQEMLDYCVRDVEITTKVYLMLKDKVKNYRDALQLEYDIKRICVEQEEYGWYFDSKKATEVLYDINEELKKVEDEVLATFKPLKTWIPKTPVKNRFKKDGRRTSAYQREVDLGCHKNDDGEYGYFTRVRFNLNSRQHIGRHLINAGWKPTEFTETGQPKIDEKVLADVDIPEAKLINRYLMLQKRKGQVDSWLEEYNRETNSIHARVHTIGTVTNRMSSSNPNLQQVTASNKEFGSEMRSLFTVHPGNVLVGADLAGLELRCLAHYMNDEEYTNEILHGDIHTANQLAAGLQSRDKAKTFIYAFLYGAGDEKVGSIVGGTKADGRKLKADFLSNTPALKTLRTRVEGASRRGYIKGLDGRQIPVRSAHSALNFLLQSAGAIIAKRAWIIFHNKCKLPFKQLGVIHDEIQVECRPEDAEEIGQCIVDSMKATTDYYKLRCPIDGEYKIGRDWNETH